MLLTDLETPRLVIRDVRPSDVDAFYAYMKREQYWQDLPIDPPTVGSIKAMVDRCLLDQGKESRTDFFLAALPKLQAISSVKRSFTFGVSAGDRVKSAGA
jgi:hypothetical protein